MGGLKCSLRQSLSRFLRTNVELIKLSLIVPDPSQPRQEFDPVELDLLEKSIASQGILQPLIVERMPGKNTFLLLDGERRHRASTRLDKKQVPAEVLEPMTDIERFIRRFHIQEQHRPWTYLDKAKAIKFMIEQGNMTPGDTATALGLSPSVVNQLLSILRFSKRIQEVAGQRRLPWSYIMDVHRSSKEVDEPKKARELEDALFNKLEDGTVRKGEDLRDYRRAIQKGGMKIVDAIINKKDYTARQALSESKAGAQKTYDSIKYTMGWLEGMLNKGIVDGAYKEVTEADTLTLRRVVEKLDKFVKLAGHTL